VSSNLTLSAIGAIKMGPGFGSHFDCAEQGSWTNLREFDQIAGDFGRCREAATIRSAAEDERRSREQSHPLRHAGAQRKLTNARPEAGVGGLFQVARRLNE
jgi:hypothetical protein